MFQPLTSKIIYDVDQLSIMQHLVHGSTLERNFKSPFRVDRSPGCWLSWYKDKLYYHDPKDFFRNGKNILSLWVIQNNCTIYEAYYKVFNFNGNKPPLPKLKEVPKYFGYGLRKWQDYDEEYWSPFKLTIGDLELGSPKLFPCAYYEYHSKKMNGLIRVYSTTEKPLYIYVWENGHVKVYAPLSKHRFIGTSNRHDYYYYENASKTLLIASGGKDAKVVHKHGISSLALNGEMYKPSNLPQIILDKYDKIIIGLDKDDTGIRFANLMKEYLDKEGYNTYICYPVLKDWALDISVYGQINII